MSHKGRGFFVVLEGLPRAGVTTQAGLLLDNLQKDGYRAFLSEEPSVGPFGNLLRKIRANSVLDKDVTWAETYSWDFNPAASGELALIIAKIKNGEPISAVNEYALLLADRMDSMHTVVDPVMEEEGIVISDRFYLTSDTLAEMAGIPLKTMTILQGKFFEDFSCVNLILNLKVGLQAMLTARMKDLPPPVYIQMTKNLREYAERYQETVDVFRNDVGIKIIDVDGEGKPEEVSKRVLQATRQNIPWRS